MNSIVRGSRFAGRAALVVALLAAAGCGDDNSAAPKPKATVTIRDACEPASFNAALGAGACTGSGTVTLTAFNNELQASHAVSAWRFDPTQLTVAEGTVVQALNSGGEVHTFTPVAQYGGGIVPSLNTASGNSTEAPECAALESDDVVAPGGTYTVDDSELRTKAQSGTTKVQCCIHPWMRATVTVTAS